MYAYVLVLYCYLRFFSSYGLCPCVVFLCSTMLYRMCAVVSFVVPILETLAVRCALPALFYLREVTEDGSVLAGVDLELPSEGAGTVPRR